MTLCEKLLDALKNYKASSPYIDDHVAFIYFSLFSTVNKEDLEPVFEKYYEMSLKNASWFGDFHKDVRQADFFSGHYYEWKQSKLTADEIIEFKELEKWFDKTSEKYMESETFDEDMKKEDANKLERFYLLNKKHKHRAKKDISGRLDAILYSMIHADVKNILKEVMSKIFKEHSTVSIGA